MWLINFFVWLDRFLTDLADKAWPTQPTEPEPVPEAPVRPVEPVPVPLPPNPSPMPTKSVLETFATAQRNCEGGPGDLNYRNNNPGNYRFSPVGYLPKYGHVTKVGGFAHFPTYELGWEYHLASIMHTAHLHPFWTIRQYVDHYAPPEDDNNNNAEYAAALAKACGVPVQTTLQTLFT